MNDAEMWERTSDDYKKQLYLQQQAEIERLKEQYESTMVWAEKNLGRLEEARKELSILRSRLKRIEESLPECRRETYWTVTETMYYEEGFKAGWSQAARIARGE